MSSTPSSWRVRGIIDTEDADPSWWLEDLDGPRDLVRVVHETRPGPSRRRVVAHADLGAEHILELDGGLTGVIDWSDAAITDPALDFARLLRDFGPSFLEKLLQAYGSLSPQALSRVEFFARCAALEDLAFGNRTGRPGQLGRPAAKLLQHARWSSLRENVAAAGCNGYRARATE